MSRKYSLLRLAVFVMATVLSLPLVSLAQGRGHGRGHGRGNGQRKEEVFVNGHDARDGRWDGRGPRRDRRRDDDDDDDYNDDRYRNRRNGRYGRNGQYGGYNDIYQIAANRGYQDGLYTGSRDAERDQSYNPQRSHYYKNATNGYDSSYGNREAYRQAYRDGFVRGYDEGYRRYDGYGNNSPRRSAGSILGDIFGRP